MNEALRLEIAAIAADSRSGATAILSRAVDVLRSAAADRDVLDEAARALCHAQPSMAAVRVAASLAQQAGDPRAALDAFAARTARAPRVIARLATGLLKLRRRGGPLRLVTCSRSHAVEQAILAVARDVAVEVACAESRPALEGRDLAAALGQSEISVTLYTDAAIAVAIPGAEAFLTGADAVGPGAFINKVGTGALAALAATEGVPTYVLAGREKFISAEIFGTLTHSGGSPEEVWRDSPPGIAVANPYFEVVRSVLVAAFVTDRGVIPPDELSDFG